jgi:acetyl-CoA acetyltransferase family protein
MAYEHAREVWIVDAVRTPVGKHGGVLSSVRPDDLAALTLQALLKRTGVPAAEVEDVVMGCANQAGEDNRNVARMALLLAGFPLEVGGVTVNRLCGSGLEAVAQAARAIMLGEAEVYIAAGVESMSRAPYTMAKAERAFPTGHSTIYDTTLGWRFVNPKMEQLGHTDALGITAENLVVERTEKREPRSENREPHIVAAQNAAQGTTSSIAAEALESEVLAEAYDIGRAAQDRFALRSHQKALRAQDEGRFADEIVPVLVRSGKSETLVKADESARRDSSLEKLAQLKPAFKPGGTVTAGNSSPLNDGAAAVLLVSAEYGRAHGLEPLARVRSMASAGVPPRVMGIGPVPATQKALQRAGLVLDDLDIVEVNEAFAAQVLAVLDAWRMDAEDTRLNPNGGAIALGHPLGASGVRILTTLVHEMARRRDVEHALATMCIGVGQGIALVVERVS